jgi:hypothetical protein
MGAGTISASAILILAAAATSVQVVGIPTPAYRTPIQWVIVTNPHPTKQVKPFHVQGVKTTFCGIEELMDYPTPDKQSEAYAPCDPQPKSN